MQEYDENDMMSDGLLDDNDSTSLFDDSGNLTGYEDAEMGADLEDILDEMEVQSTDEAQEVHNGETFSKALSGLRSKSGATAGEGITPRICLEASLTNDATASKLVNNQNINLLTEVALDTPMDVTQAKALRAELLKSKENIADYYKQLEETRLIAEAKELETHCASVKGNFEAKRTEYCQSLSKLNATINTLRDNADTTIANAAYESLKSAITEFKRLRKEYAEYTLNTYLIIQFLENYKQIYPSYRKLEINHKYSKIDFVKDLDIDKEIVTLKCNNCGETVTTSFDNLPNITIGRATYSLDIKGNILRFGKLATEMYNKVVERGLAILTKGLEASGDENLKQQVEALKTPLEKLNFLHKQNVVAQSLNEEDRNQYLKVIVPQLSSDVRNPLFGLLSNLCLPTKALGEIPMFKNMAGWFDNYLVPTPLNVLGKVHPLCAPNDEINAYPSEYNSATGKSLQAEYLKFGGRNAHLGEFLLSKVETCFNYPNLKYCTTAKMSSNMVLNTKSPLRFHIPNYKCGKCGCQLVFPTAVMTACNSYATSKAAEVTIGDLGSTGSLSLVALLTPVRIPKLRVKEKFSNKATETTLPHKSQQSEIKPNYQQIPNFSYNLKRAVSKDAVENSAIRVAQVKAEYGLVNEALAIRICEALDNNNFTEVSKIVEENKRLLNGESITTPKESSEEFVFNDESEETPKSPESAPQPKQEAPKEDEEDAYSLENLLNQYNGADLNTLSYEELTSKGLYKYENLLRAYHLNPVEYNTVEEILFKLNGDDKSLSELPKALQESIKEKYDIYDGMPDEFIQDGILL